MTIQTANLTSIRAHDSIRIEVTEYDAITGLPIKKLTSLNFGAAQLNNFSTPIVIKMNVIGVQKIDSIKLGLISSSEDVAGSGSLNSDNSVTNGNFGIEHASKFTRKTSLVSFFAGDNLIESPSSLNNVLIKNTSETESEFVYLNIKTTNSVNRGFVTFKWFFNFS